MCQLSENPGSVNLLELYFSVCLIQRSAESDGRFMTSKCGSVYGASLYLSDVLVKAYEVGQESIAAY